MNSPRAEGQSVGAVDRRSDEHLPDRLERLPLARKVASLIGSYRGREGLAIGIEGPWGAGKTGFTALVLKEVEDTQCATLLPFNPWSLSAQNELAAEFFAALAGVLARDVNEPRSPTSYGARLRATALRSLRIAGRGRTRPPHEERGDVHEKLGNLRGRILVVIDDIDRLDEDQTRIVMKLVRVASSLPNLVFLLVYDRGRVAASLAEEGRPGEDVLKTLVHIAFTLPEPGRQELDAVLFAQLRDVIARVYGESHIADADERWRELVHGTLPPLFSTIADVTGFAKSLRLAFGMAGTADVNRVDFVGIEAIRFFAPHLYAALSTNTTLFTGAADDGAERRSRYEDVLRSAPEGLRAAVDAVCRSLFPRLAAAPAAAELRELWRREKRVCSEDAFTTYFQLGIAEPLVSESEVLFLRRRFEDAEAVTALLRQYLVDRRLAPLLAQLTGKSTIVSESDARALLLGLWALEPEIDDSPAAEETRALALQLARDLLRDAVDAGDRSRFLSDLVAATSATVFPAALTSALDRQPL